jgi:uncharacterized membrane protein
MCVRGAHELEHRVAMEPAMLQRRQRVVLREELAEKLVYNTSAYVSIRQHTSAYVSIRQHTSAYVSIRQQEEVAEELVYLCPLRQFFSICTSKSK